MSKRLKASLGATVIFWLVGGIVLGILLSLFPCDSHDIIMMLLVYTALCCSLFFLILDVVCETAYNEGYENGEKSKKQS